MSDQAVKIFEALSDVDQDLLERCNQKVRQKTTTVYGLYRKYGKAMAACICLIVVGAVAWNGYRLVTGSCGSDSSGSNSAPAEISDKVMSVTVADGGAAYADNTAGAEGNVFEEGTGSAAGAAEGDLESADISAASSMASAGEATDWAMGTDQISAEAYSESRTPEAAPTEGVKQQAMQNLQSQTSADKTDRLKESEVVMDSRKEIPWEDACLIEPFNKYLPTILPAGYEAFSARQSSFPDLWNNMIFKWTDGEHIFFLSMTQDEMVTREEIAQRDGLYEYLADDFQKEMIPESQPMGEPIIFTLYYADGMRIDFEGYITADEMWDVVESVCK